MRRHHAIACLIAAVSLAGCGYFSSKSAEKRDLLQRDSQGRLVRVDPKTGELIPVDTFSTPATNTASKNGNVARSAVSRRGVSSSQPRSVSENPPAKTSQRAESGALRTAGTTAAAAVSPAAPESPASATAPGTPVIPDTRCLDRTIGPAVVVSDGANVFFRPQAAPMASLSRGTAVTVLDIRADWRLVRYVDKEWGQRAGYIRCWEVAPSSPRTQ